MTNDGCREVRELLTAFLDDELPCERSHEIQEHLDACEGCGVFARLERGFTRAMRARIPRLQPPASLVERVRDGWRGIGDRPAGDPPGPVPDLTRATSLWGRLASSRAAWGLAAAVLAAVLLAPAVSIYAPDAFYAYVDSVTGVRKVSGVLVCIECEKHGAPLEVQKHCHAQGHQTGLKCARTGLWHFVADEASGGILADPAMRGSQVVVEGRFLSDIHYVDVKSVAMAPGT